MIKKTELVTPSAPELILVRPLRQEMKGALINRAVDFWLLGGISLIAWVFSQAATYGFNWNDGFDRQILSWPYAFSALSLVCNYPHFVASYRIGYGGGRAQVVRQWFALILVPILLIGLFFAAFRTKSVGFASFGFVTEDLGKDLLRVGVWLMWLTVGWHYAKQSFGVMLRYAGYDRYPLTRFQRNILKYALLSIVPPNFIVMISEFEKHSTPDFQDLSMSVFHIPEWAIFVSYGIAIGLGGIFVGVILRIYQVHRKPPSINFLMPWVAFTLWWFPKFWPIPYSMIMVPFFHSLQYLPFAYHRLEGELSEKSRKRFSTVVTLNVFGILAAGFLLFDLIPTWLDNRMDARIHFGSSFFVIASLLFFNVHHFFVDASIWKSRKTA